MKLYSRGQVLFFSLLSAAIVIFFAVGLGFLKPLIPKVNTEKIEEVAQIRVPPVNEQIALHGQDLQITERNMLLSEYLAHNTADLVQFSESERENIAIYELYNSAVVNITTETMALNWFLEPVPQEGSSGSGSIIDTRGFVLTNNHVIQNANRVFINLADGSQFEGSIVGVDPENDIAVLKFSPPQDMELRVIPYGDSSNLMVGQKVLAIGNPFALERTLTVGIVSGLGRPIQTSRNRIIRDMIQTDASINPGNSGGPLLDTQGRMIGINTMIYSPSGGSVGIGFAVPVNTAKRVVTEIMQHGRVRRGWIDATVVQIFPSLVRYARLPVNSGLLVSRTRRGGLAERAGLRQGTEQVQYGRSIIYLGGDIITSVNGIKTDTLADLYSSLEASRPGDVVKVEIIRGGQTSTLEITLADREEVMN